MSWLLLGWGLVAALLAVNSLWPVARATRVLIGPSYGLQLVASELVPLHVLLNLFGTALLIWHGGLAEWPGWLGAAAAALALVGQWRVAARAARTEAILAEALEPLGGLGDALERPVSHRLQPVALIAGPWRRIDDISYGAAGARNRLDVYVPADAGQARSDAASGAPVLVWIHGGGWILGHKRQQGRPLIEEFLRHGWVCVSINYRLSPRVKYPEHLVDCKRALAWVHEHIGEYGGDPARIVVSGGSAGAQLASMVALTQGAPEYQPGFEHADTSVRACVSLYGPYDIGKELLQARRVWFASAMARQIFGTTPWEDQARFEEASLFRRIHPEAPAFFVLHGTADVMVGHLQARRFVDALRRISRQPVLYAELPGAMHAFDVMRSLRTTLVVQGILRFAERVVQDGAGRSNLPAPSATPTMT